MDDYRRQSSRTRHSSSWTGVVVLGFVVAASVWVARYSYLRYVEHQLVQSFQEVGEASRRAIEERRQADERTRRQRAAERALKLGQRCLSGKFIYQIEGGWADDPSQDWKCKPPSDR